MVPDVLLLAVPRGGGGVLFAIAPPVVRVAGPPLLRTVPAYLSVFGVRSDLLAVIVGATTARAPWLAANQLSRLIL